MNDYFFYLRVVIEAISCVFILDLVLIHRLFEKYKSDFKDSLDYIYPGFVENILIRLVIFLIFYLGIFIVESTLI